MSEEEIKEKEEAVSYLHSRWRSMALEADMMWKLWSQKEEESNGLWELWLSESRALKKMKENINEIR